MSDFLKTGKSNPRGIPQAPFIEKPEKVMKNPEEDFDQTLSAFQNRLQQYKFMEVSKRQQVEDLKIKIPDIEKNLNIIGHINDVKRKDEDDEKTIETNFELNDTLYTRAVVDASNLNSVYLWLGADVMLEYPIEEAVQLLKDRLKTNKEQLQLVKEDLDFLKENITTMEVNTARLYNWDVERRRKLKKAEK